MNKQQLKNIIKEILTEMNDDINVGDRVVFEMTGNVISFEDGVASIKTNDGIIVKMSVNELKKLSF